MNCAYHPDREATTTWASKNSSSSPRLTMIKKYVAEHNAGIEAF